MGGDSTEEEPCASCVWMAKLGPFAFALWGANEFRTLPRGHPNRKYTALVGGLFFAAGVWFNAQYAFESMNAAEQKSQMNKA